MHDVYAVDTDHLQDAQGRTRMRLVADSVPDQADAVRAGLAACLDLLTTSGALDAARGHTVNAPAYPNPETVVKFALSLGEPFTTMNRFWIQNMADGTLTEHVPTVAELADELRDRKGVDAAAALADALAALAAVARNPSSSQVALEAALRFFVMLRGVDWASAPKPFEVHGGVGISWKHTVRRATDGALRMGGRFSAVITGSRVVLLRTTNISTAVASAEIVFDDGTPVHVFDFFRTGRLPGEQDEAPTPAPQESAAQDTGPDPTPEPEPAPEPDTAPEPEPVIEQVQEKAAAEEPTAPAEPQLPQLRLVARWNIDSGDLHVTTLEGEPIPGSSGSLLTTAADQAQAEAALDGTGFERRGGWVTVSSAPRELRVAVTQKTAA